MFNNRTSLSSISNSFSSAPGNSSFSASTSEVVVKDSSDADDILEKSDRENTTTFITTRSSINSKSTWVWNYFKRVKDSKTHALCLQCQKEIYYMKSWSTGMLERHTKRYNLRIFKEAFRLGEKKLPAMEDSSSQITMDGFVQPCPTLQQCIVDWAVSTYQPLRCCEEETFRDLCQSLNKKSPILSQDELHTLVQLKYIQVQQKIKSIVVNRYFSITTDFWTSLANQGYTACTVHFVGKDSWQLHSLVLGIFEKKGPSTAVDNISCVEQQLPLFDLHYKNMAAIVKDRSYHDFCR
jgi:hypothetical protein